MTEVSVLIEGYWQFLKDRTVLRHVDDWTEITTPYLDRHNDYIQVYVRKNGSGYVVTDGGDTLVDLEQSGCAIDSPKRQAILKTILQGFGIERQGNDLRVHTTSDNFAVRKHNLLQAILSVHDMFFLASATVEALFFEDVASWFDMEGIRFTPRVKFAGKSGFDHMFDFVIPKSRVSPERIVRAINSPNRTTALAYITAWLDTRDSRPEDARSFAFLNDNDRVIGGNVTDALFKYDITPVQWSLRDRFRERLIS